MKLKIIKVGRPSVTCKVVYEACGGQDPMVLCNLPAITFDSVQLLGSTGFLGTQENITVQTKHSEE